MASVFSVVGDIFLRDRASKAIQRVDRNISRLQSNSQRFGEGARGVSQGVASIGIAATVASIPLKKAIGVAAGFEFQMDKVRSITKGTAEELAGMENEAKRVGATTSKSALQSAGALELISKAGFNASDSISLLSKVVTLSEAGSIDLASATDIIAKSTRSLKGSFKDGMPAVERATKLTDIMAFSQSNSSATILEMGQTFKLLAPAIRDFKIPIGQVAAGISLLANKGIIATRAGTSMAAMFDKLIKPTDTMAKKLLSLGLVGPKGKKITKITQLPLHDLPALIKTIGDGLNKIKDDNERSGFIARLFGTRGRRAFGSLFGAGADEIRRFAEEANNAVGFAQKVAKQRLDNFIGQWIILKSTVESVGIAVGDVFVKGDKSFSPMMKKVTEGVRSLVKAFAFIDGGLDAFGANKGLTKKERELVSFVIGFKEGAEEGIKIIKEMAKETKKFFGLFVGEGEDANRELGKTIGKFLTLAIVMGPLFLALTAVGLVVGGLSNAVRGLGQLFLALGGGKVLGAIGVLIFDLGKLALASDAVTLATTRMGLAWLGFSTKIKNVGNTIKTFLKLFVVPALFTSAAVASALFLAAAVFLIATNLERAGEATVRFFERTIVLARDFISRMNTLFTSALNFIFVDFFGKGFILLKNTIINGSTALRGILTGDTQLMVDSLKAIWSDYGNFVGNLFQKDLPFFMRSFEGALVDLVLDPFRLFIIGLQESLKFLADVARDAGFSDVAGFLDQRVANFQGGLDNINFTKFLENQAKFDNFLKNNPDLGKRGSTPNAATITTTPLIPPTRGGFEQPAPSAEPAPQTFFIENTVTLDGEIVSKAVAKKFIEASERSGQVISDTVKQVILDNGILAGGTR